MNNALKGPVMERGTMMVLKRLFYVALGALGLSALAAGPASAQNEIPAPEGLRDLTSCIEMNTPDPMDRPRSAVKPGPDFTDAGIASTVRDVSLYGVLDCTDMSFDPEADAGDGVDLMDSIDDARLAFIGLPDSDDDDYAEELAEVRARYSGAIFEAVPSEVKSEAEAKDAKDDLGEIATKLHAADGYDFAGDGTKTDDLHALYTGLTLHVEAQTDGDDAVEIKLPTITGVTFDNGVLEPVATPTTAVGVPINWSTNIGALITDRRTSEVAIANAQEALAAHNAEEDGAELSSSQRSALSEYIEIHETRVSRLNSAISLIERNPADATNADHDSGDYVDAFKDAISAIERAHATANNERKAHTGKSGEVESSLQDPGNLLEALVNLAEADLDRAVDRGDEGDDLKPFTDALAEAQAAQTAYNRATADSENPASALLASLIAADDTGQALLDAVTTNHDTANEAKVAAEDAVSSVSGLVGEDGKIAEIEGKLAAKKMYIDNIGVEMGFNAATGEGTVMLADGMMGSRIDKNEQDIGMNTGHIMDNRGMIETNTGNIAANTMGIESNTAGVSMNSGRIDAAESMIGQNQGNISGNTAMIGELSESLEVVRAGVAASMALAGMPAINGRGISIGVGSFDGESAFAIGFQIQNEATSFKVGLTSGGGATGASAGVGFQF